MVSDAPPVTEGWIHEVKFDGYRALCDFDDGAVRFTTRGGQDWTERFPEPAAAVAAIAARRALLGGELSSSIIFMATTVGTESSII